jgi:hypothetical protein
MSRLHRLAALALCAFALIARGESLRLLAPANGATLRGGAFAELHWSSAELPPRSEEWEAFLSINGGAYYAFRITPHLEIDLQRFTFIVPNVDARDARILIRVGDEVRETVYESASSFSIKRDPRAEHIAPRLMYFGRGEAAREGDAPVIAWTDGARDGSGLAQRCAPVSHHDFLATTKVAGDVSAAMVSGNSWMQRVQPCSIVTALRAVADRDVRTFERLPQTADLLLVCRRRNI